MFSSSPLMGCLGSIISSFGSLERVRITLGGDGVVVSADCGDAFD